MAIIKSWIHELEVEALATLKVLELIPDDKLDYAPHEKSFTLGKLASHISNLLGWGKFIMEQDEIVMDGKPFPEYKSKKEIIESFNKQIIALNETLAKSEDSSLKDNWSLKDKEKTYFTLPRGIATRRFIFNHLIHHRAQLIFYLRMLDIPIPGMYGPSKDEM